MGIAFVVEFDVSTTLFLECLSGERLYAVTPVMSSNGFDRATTTDYIASRLYSTIFHYTDIDTRQTMFLSVYTS